MRAGLIATQILGMALCRFVLRLPPVVEMTRDEIVEWLGPTIQRYLGPPDGLTGPQHGVSCPQAGNPMRR